ncbi:MAG: relaxase domain-containing protein [Rhodospirillaceae bacterium]|nr:relaxase domain-containing protein [Rhodospirillaceae bacterium]
MRSSAGTRAIEWFERNAAETWMQDPASGGMIRAGGQKALISTFRHETSRNLDPALHWHQFAWHTPHRLPIFRIHRFLSA